MYFRWTRDANDLAEMLSLLRRLGRARNETLPSYSYVKLHYKSFSHTFSFHFLTEKIKRAARSVLIVLFSDIITRPKITIDVRCRL